METSSRIFVKGLPPTFADAEFRKHFAFGGKDVTDAKIFPSRRIGYIGYKTPEDAKKAVKYFDRTFIRMSRIGVEIARPVQEQTRPTPTVQRADNAVRQEARKADIETGKQDDGKPVDDPKLKEFLESYKPKSKKRAWEGEGTGANATAVAEQERTTVAEVGEEQSEDEVQELPRKAKRAKTELTLPVEESEKKVERSEPTDISMIDPSAELPEQTAVSDADWARSRTSRLLGLLDEDEEDAVATQNPADGSSDRETEEPIKGNSASKAPAPEASLPSPPSDDKSVQPAHDREDAENEALVPSMRLFVRNLSYDVQQEDLMAEFAPFGDLDEVHVPLDKKTGQGKGFAFLQFTSPEAAAQALQDRDGTTFQGRLLHIIPAKAKKENKLDDFALSKLPLKKQQEIKRRREAASSTFNWNALYMNADAVVSSVADRLGIAKSAVLDPTSSDAAVKQAHAETHVIQETKAYFTGQGVDLDAFKRSQRGDTAILAKNIPFDCSRDELKRLFEEHGEIRRFLMPPSGTIAVIEFPNPAQCQAAFGSLAYRRIKSSMLFLEKAPKDLFTAKAIGSGLSDAQHDGVTKTSASDLKDAQDATVPDTAGSATLFVRNLNFSTTSQLLTETFKPLSGFMSARVKTKTDPKKPGQVLSMGFGFLEFHSSQNANAALKAMDGHALEGHKLQLRASHKGADAAEERRKEDKSRKSASRSTKIIVKNLPFEASKKDVRALFGAYGQLRSVRVPKKMDRGARGFAFVDFTTPKEAEAAMDALRDTHLLGRRLVLDFAAADAVDAEEEIERMQKKVGGQMNKVALQKLTSGGRKKFTTVSQDDDQV